MPEFRLPDLGEGLQEADILAWRVQVGDRVEIDQVVVEVETAKAAVEVPVPFAGVVATLHARAGQSLAVGSPLITVDAGGPATAPRSGNVLIGYGTPDAAPRRKRARGRPGSAAPAQGSAATAADGPVAVSSPLVRKLARDAHLDLRQVRGTGPDGLVRRGDVERASRPRDPDGPAPVNTEQRIPLTGVRKAIAERLTRSRREIPDATVWVDVDATDLLAARAALTASDPGHPVGVLGLLARFTVLALRRHPELNGRVEGEEIVLPTAVHLGLAAQTDRGLMVPVVHDAHRLSTRELAAAIAGRAAAARAGSLTPADMRGGTFTVNNYGVFGVDGSAAIINHPEVAILGIGRIIERAWVVDGELAVRQVTQLTLTFDHRVCDGGTAGGFLRLVADYVESPVTSLGDL